MLKIYESLERYLMKFEESTKKQLEDGWITKSDYRRIIEWIKKRAKEII